MWQQRIYTFILRRLLGPYLTPQSRNRLHHSLRISLREGRLELLDIDLDGAALAGRLGLRVEVGVAHVKKLCVSLALVYDSNDDTTNTDDESTTTPDNQTTTTATGAARLVASIQLDGVTIQLTPIPTTTNNNHTHPPQHTTTTTPPIPTTNNEATSTSTTSRAKGAIQSYVNAALDSLRLELQITNLKITLESPTTDDEYGENRACGVVTVESISYHDAESLVEENSAAVEDDGGDGGGKQVIGKDVCITGVKFSISDSTTTNHECPYEETLVQMDGCATIQFRVLSSPDDTTTNTDQVVEMEACQKKVCMRRFCEIRLPDEVVCGLHTRWFGCLNRVITDGMSAVGGGGPSAATSGGGGGEEELLLRDDEGIETPTNPNDSEDSDSDSEDEDDMGLLSNIVQQQIEAHRLASTHEVRGGLLLPDFSSLHPHALGRMNTAQTKQQQQQQQQQPNNGNNAVVTFDAFFDANDEGFSQYQNLLGGDGSATENGGGLEEGGEEGWMSSQVAFYLKEISFTLHLDEEDDGGGGEPIATTEEDHDGAYLVLRLGDCNVVSRRPSRAVSDVSVGIGFLEMEDGDVRQEERKYQKECVLHFVEEESTENQVVLSSNECISIMNTTKTMGKNQTATDIIVKMAPLQLFYKKRTVANIQTILDLIALQTSGTSRMNNDTSENNDDLTNNIETSLHVNLTCDHITASLPLDYDIGGPEVLGGGGTKRHVNIERFFERSGYSVEYPDGLTGPCLTMVVLELAVDASRAIPSNDTSSSKGKVDCDADLSIRCTCQKFLFSISAPIDGHSSELSASGPDSIYAYRMDFLSLESETQIDPDAIIKLEYTRTSIGGLSDVAKRKRAKKNFPVVTQLSFVKASQQHESEDIDKTYQSYEEGQNYESANSKPNKSSSSTIRASDPQAMMLKEASSCGSYVSAHVPSIVADLSSCEIVDILTFIRQLTTEFGEAEKKPHNADNNNATDNVTIDRTGAPNTGLTFRCDQLSIALHEDENDDEDSEGKDKKAYSQIFICDGIRTHCMLASNEVENARFIANDVTLYEVSNFGPKNKNSTKYSSNLSVKSSISYRCNLIRRRRVYNSQYKIGAAIFFRSKLSNPLSPKTPALVIDMMIKKDGEDIERSLHLSIYDMTYRYELDSQWVDRLKVILQVGIIDKDDDIALESNASKEDMPALTVTKLFITLSDCNFDYSSPDVFNTASSTIIRVGEVRISSNLIIPAGPVQAFKVSVADVALFLSNRRSTHDVENLRLSCSNLIFDSPKYSAIGSVKILNGVMLPQSFEDAMFKMNFISISTLDYLDAAIATTKFNEEANVQYEGINNENDAPPDMMVTLSIGRACLFTCGDSFACLSETANDLILKLSMPTPEELEGMKLQNPTEKSGDLVAEYSTHSESSKIIGVTEIEQHNDGSMEEISASIYDGNSSSLAEVMKHELFSSIDNISDVNSELFYDGNIEAKTQNNLEGVNSSMGDTQQTESQHGQKLDLDSNEEVLLKYKTVMIQDFYAIKKDHSELSDGSQSCRDTTLTDANHVGNNNNHSLVGNWTTVDYLWSQDSSVPADVDQCGGWYSFDDDRTSKVNNNLDNKSQVLLLDNITVVVEGKNNGRVPRVFPRHILINPVSDPLAGGDMGASKFATRPLVKLRVMVKEMSVCCRFFDGYDWKAPKKFSSTHSTAKRENGQKANDIASLRDDSKTKLKNELFGDNIEFREDGMFEQAEMMNAKLRVPTEYGTRRKCRQPHRFFQFSYCGLKLRSDTFTDCTDHCLASCMELSLRDMFISETISSGVPLKIIGEWANDHEHPRDSNDGLLMMKMVSVHPDKRVSANGKLMGNESRVALDLLPIRCYIHQGALRFIRGFFSGEENCQNKNDGCKPGNSPPETFFQVFKVKPFKVKVDYTPYEIDTSALKDGNYIEILNLLPLEEMVLKLKAVELRNLTGWGSVLSELTCKWVQDVSSTQIHKFLTTTSPIHPIANVGDGVKQFVMIPLEEYRQRGHVRKAFQRGTLTLAEVVAYETLNISSKLTSLAARKLGGSTTNRKASDLEPFPMRPETVPRSIGDVSNHAMASLSRGLKEANAKVVIMPYREYHKTGSKGSLKCVIKGIPVAICAPLSGVAEALSYTCCHLRNQLRPEIRKEEEASKQFQHDY